MKSFVAVVAVVGVTLAALWWGLGPEIGQSAPNRSLQPADSPSAPATSDTTTSTVGTAPALAPFADESQPNRPTEPTAPEEEPVVVLDATPPDANWVRPELFEERADPVYGTTVTRVTSADGTRFNRNTYSRRNPENTDGTLFFSYHGEAEYRVYGVETGALVSVLAMHADAEPQWHPTNPLLIRHIAGPNSSAGDLRLYELNLATGVTSVIADLTERVQTELPGASYLYDRAEGTPSADGTRYAWIVYNSAEQPLGLVSYDLAIDTIGGVLAFDGRDTLRADWASATPSGDHVMASGTGGTYAYDFDLTNERKLHDDAEHSDIALSATGRDTYVYVDFSADTPTAGWVVAKDVVTGDATPLFDLYDDANTSIHVSGKAYDKPGWVIMSTYNCKDGGAWSCEKVFAVDFDNIAVVPLAHTYNCGESYWTEPHAASNRDMSRVYFNSDAGSCGIDAEVYRLDVGDALG